MRNFTKENYQELKKKINEIEQKLDLKEVVVSKGKEYGIPIKVPIFLSCYEEQESRNYRSQMTEFLLLDGYTLKYNDTIVSGKNKPVGDYEVLDDGEHSITIEVNKLSDI